MINKKTTILILIVLTFLTSFCTTTENKIDDMFTYAKSRTNDLQLGVYITAHAVNDLLNDEVGRREAISIFRANGITKAYVEVYRGGLVVEQSLLEKVRDTFLENEIEVVGGIATVPGKDFGIKQEGKLGWFNWQNQKTQNDLKEVVTMSAKVFDEFIVDDFLCTSDTSDESKIAKGDKSWSQYRRDLLTKLSTEIFIEPAKKVNPNITMIIKYPQWYDRFHLFGYELEREPQLFDKVYVGTETRGQYTQRFGFVQPYEGFVNFSWIKDIVGNKIGAAWFDHGDCDANDFIEQAYQSVLAGAKEITIFNYFDFVNGHKGHHLLRTQFQYLADLAKTVEVNPVEGVVGYKPINSDAGGDLYLMDFIGTLGVPLVPVHQYPTETKVILLPTQAAADKEILSKVKSSLSSGTVIIFTTGFLANVNDGERFADLAGVKYPIKISPQKAEKIIVNGNPITIKNGLDLEGDLVLTASVPLLNAKVGSSKIPFLIKSKKKGSAIFTLNSHTFSQKDFDKVGEVLLCPKSLGLLEIPKSWVNTIRESFTSKLDFSLDAKTRIVVQSLGATGWMFHNYNKTKEVFTFASNKINNISLVNGFTREVIEADDGKLTLTMKPRSRVRVKIVQVDK